jgi:hypothetical protein
MIALVNLITRFNEKSLFLSLIYLVLLGFAWLWITRIKSSWRKILITILLFLSLRFVLFGNPFAWTIYSKLVDHDTLDQRLGMLIEYKIQDYLRYPDKVHYLAVGTSQVYALFAQYIKDHDFIRRNNIAGILPNEYFLCQELISNSPDTLILYLSEFDFCRVPNYTSLYVLPEQYWGWFSKASILQRNYPGKKFECNPYKLLINDCFPEFKYRLIFRNIVLNLLNFDKVGPQLQDKTLKTHLENLQLLKDDGLIEYHARVFEHFIREATSHGKTIIICEGTYNPLALTPKNQVLRHRVEIQLESLAKRYPHVRYVPLQDQYPLTLPDFQDGYHVTHSAGYRWVDYLFTKVIPAIQTKEKLSNN